MITHKDIKNLDYNLSLVYFNTGDFNYVLDVNSKMLKDYTHFVDGYMIRSMADGDDCYMDGTKEPVTNIMELDPNQLLEIINENKSKWEQI